MTKTKVGHILDATESLSGARLIALRRLAQRKGVWSCLTAIERGITNLTIKVVKSIHSNSLTQTLSKIVAKLSQAIKTGYMYKVEIVGRPRAERLSQLVYSWGNKDALRWKDDPAFIRHLGMDAYFSGVRA